MDDTVTVANGNTKKRGPKVVAGETKRERFERLTQPRVEVALHRIRLISAVGGSNRYRYDYGQTDVDMIVAALKEEVDKLAIKMRRTATQMPMFRFDKQAAQAATSDA